MKNLFALILLFSVTLLQAQQVDISVGGMTGLDKDTLTKACFSGQFIPIVKRTMGGMKSIKMAEVSVKVYSESILLGTVDLKFPVTPDANEKIKALVEKIKVKGYIYYEKPVADVITEADAKEKRVLQDMNIFIDQKKGRKCK